MLVEDFLNSDAIVYEVIIKKPHLYVILSILEVVPDRFWRRSMVLMTQHSHCEACGEPMPKARFGQRYCSQGCRERGKSEEGRVARRLWREAGRPREFEAIDLVALGLASKPQPVKRRRIAAVEDDQQQRDRRDGTECQAEQAERRALVGSTTTPTTKAAEPQSYFSRARAGLDDDGPGGRFAAGGYVSGSERTTDYPRLPNGSPWAGDAVGLEPPLGFSVNDLEPSGEAYEVERSLAQLAEAVAPVPVAQSPVGVVETASAIPTPAEARLAEILPRLAVPISGQPKLERRRI